MSASVELPRWKCHKEVLAFKITSVNENVLHGDGLQIEVSQRFLAKHVPRTGGYYVRYEDGYESYSPAEAFEGGYTRI